MKKTKTAAIKYARENVGELFKFGDGYKFLRKAHGLNAHHESISREYHAAQSARSSALIAEAQDFLGNEHVPYEGGKWTDYIQTHHQRT